MLDVRRLKVLCEVARNGSFSGAAAALGYTQPAVSRQIATLEAETGTLLVRRVPQGVVLTDAGRLLVDRGAAILARLQDAELELQGARRARGRQPADRVVRFGGGVDRPARDRALPRPLPGGRADGRDGRSDRLAAAAARRRARHGDLARPAGRRGPPTDGCRSCRRRTKDPRDIELVHLFDDPMYVALPAGHPLADEYPLELSDFADEPWMLATTHPLPRLAAVSARVPRGWVRAADRVPERRLSGDPRVRRGRRRRRPDPRHGRAGGSR